METHIFVGRTLAANAVALACLASMADCRTLATSTPECTVNAKVMKALERLAQAPLGQAYVDEIEDQAEQLLPQADSVVEELFRILQNSEGLGRHPVCDVTALLGVLGRSEAPRTADRLISVLPTKERADDLCIVGGVVTLGPSVWELLANRAKTAPINTQSYYAALALLAPLSGTEFSQIIGLEKAIASLEDRDERIRMIEEWEEWWTTNHSRYVWNNATNTLQLVDAE